MGPERGGFGSEKGGFGSKRGDLGPEGGSFKSERGDLGPEGVIWGLKEPIWGLRSFRGGTYVRNRSPLCPTGHRPFGAAAQKERVRVALGSLKPA